MLKSLHSSMKFVRFSSKYLGGHIRYLTYCTIKNTRIDDKVHATIGPQLMTR